MCWPRRPRTHILSTRLGHFYWLKQKSWIRSRLLCLKMMMKDRSDENISNLLKRKIILHQKRRDWWWWHWPWREGRGTESWWSCWCRPSLTPARGRPPCTRLPTRSSRAGSSSRRSGSRPEDLQCRITNILARLSRKLDFLVLENLIF